MKPRDAAIYLFLAVVWGFSFLLVLQTTLVFGWAGSVAFRTFVAAATLFALAAAMRRRLSFTMGWRPLAVVGATTVAGQLAGFSYAAPQIGTAMTAIIVASIPLFSMLIAGVAGVERMSGRTLAGLTAGFVGIMLLVGFPAAPVTAGFVLGCAASLGAAVSAAAGSVYAAHRMRRDDPYEVTTGAFVFGTLFMLPLLLAVPPQAVPGVGDVVAILVQGAVMSAATYVLYFKLVASIGPTRAISVEFAVTVIAVIVGAVVLGERLSAVQIVGAGVIIAGCALVLGLVPQRRRPQPSRL